MTYRVPFPLYDRVVDKAGMLTSNIQNWLTTFLAAVNPTVVVASGSYTDAPTLTASDAGRLYMVGAPYWHLVMWNGSAWTFTDGGNKYTADFPEAPTAGGWYFCDGNPTDYLTVGATLGIAVFTPVNPANTFSKSVTATPNTLDAAVAPGMSGLTTVATATNQAAATGITVIDHPSHTHDVASSLATPDLFAADVTASGVSGRSGAPSATLTHPVTDPNHNHIQDAHQHLFGTIAADSTGRPPARRVITMFRR